MRAIEWSEHPGPALALRQSPTLGSSVGCVVSSMYLPACTCPTGGLAPRVHIENGEHLHTTSFKIHHVIPLQAIPWQTALQQAVPLVHCFAWWLSEAIAMANANHRHEQQKTTRMSRHSGVVTAGHLGSGSCSCSSLSAFYKLHTKDEDFSEPPFSTRQEMLWISFLRRTKVTGLRQRLRCALTANIPIYLGTRLQVSHNCSPREMTHTSDMTTRDNFQSLVTCLEFAGSRSVHS